MPRGQYMASMRWALLLSLLLHLLLLAFPLFEAQSESEQIEKQRISIRVMKPEELPKTQTGTNAEKVSDSDGIGKPEKTAPQPRTVNQPKAAPLVPPSNPSPPPPPPVNVELDKPPTPKPQEVKTPQEKIPPPPAPSVNTPEKPAPKMDDTPPPRPEKVKQQQPVEKTPPKPQPDPYAYLKYYPTGRGSQLPAPTMRPSGPSSPGEVFNRGGGTLGAARILPLDERDGYSFRNRQEAFASLGITLRKFRTTRETINPTNQPISGIRTAQGVRSFKKRVKAGLVIRIGFSIPDTEVDARMTALEREYLGDKWGKVEVYQVEYQVIIGKTGCELAVRNIYHSGGGG
jgi:hypothetical protein